MLRIQQVVDHRPQTHWRHRFVQQMDAVFARIEQRFRRRVPADQESRQSGAVFGAQPLDRLYTGCAAASR